MPYSDFKSVTQTSLVETLYGNSIGIANTWVEAWCSITVFTNKLTLLDLIMINQKKKKSVKKIEPTDVIPGDLHKFNFFA